MPWTSGKGAAARIQVIRVPRATVPTLRRHHNSHGSMRDPAGILLPTPAPAQRGSMRRGDLQFGPVPHRSTAP
jgi:hypothetical protein